MPLTDNDAIRQLLTDIRTIALVGASDKHDRPSHEVMAFLQGRGYRVFPVNPRLAGQTILGEQVYGSVTDIGQPIDMVDVFLHPDRVEPVVDDALAAGAGAGAGVLWLQIGVINATAARRAEAAGLTVVMNRCPKQEIHRLGVMPVSC